MAEKTLGSYQAYGDLALLSVYGVGEQQRINALSLPEEEKYRQMAGLVGELDTVCSYYQQDVLVAGCKVFNVPLIPIGIDSGDTLMAEPLKTENILEYDTATGFSAGFAAKTVGITYEGESLGTRLVLCHMIHTGEQFTKIDEEGNLHIIKVMGYFAVESSEVHFLQDGLAHNIIELRDSPNAFYESLDIIIYDEASSLTQKLQAVYELLQATDFDNLSEERQTEITSYLNSCMLLTPFQVFQAQYALAGEDKRDLFILNEVYVPANFHRFVMSSCFELTEDDEGYSLKSMGTGLGLEMTMYQGDDDWDVTVPLGQIIRIRDGA